MKRILLISQHFNFKESSSTAISINTRINGIKDQFAITVFCSKNNEHQAPTDPMLTKVECDFDAQGKSEYEKVALFATEAFDFCKEQIDNFDLVILHTNNKPTHDLIGKIQEISNIKIIGYFPDPYVHSFRAQLDGEATAERLASEYNAYKLADKAIVTNEFFKELITSEYPEFSDTIEHIYHCYDDIDYKETTSLNFVFLGAVTFGRKIDNVLIAFDQLITENPEFKKFRFVASIINSNSLLTTISKLENKGNFQFIKKRITFTEANQIELSAYCLVNIALPLPEKQIDPYFPTKLAQAFKTKKPILSISNNPGLSSSLMERTGNYYAHNDVAEIKAQLHQIMKYGSSNNKLEELSKFNTRYTSKKFKKIINEVLDRT